MPVSWEICALRGFTLGCIAIRKQNAPPAVFRSSKASARVMGFMLFALAFKVVIFCPQIRFVLVCILTQRVFKGFVFRAYLFGFGGHEKIMNPRRDLRKIQTCPRWALKRLSTLVLFCGALFRHGGNDPANFPGGHVVYRVSDQRRYDLLNGAFVLDCHCSDHFPRSFRYNGIDLDLFHG